MYQFILNLSSGTKVDMTKYPSSVCVFDNMSKRSCTLKKKKKKKLGWEMNTLCWKCNGYPLASDFWKDLQCGSLMPLLSIIPLLCGSPGLALLAMVCSSHTVLSLVLSLVNSYWSFNSQLKQSFYRKTFWISLNRTNVHPLLGQTLCLSLLLPLDPSHREKKETKEEGREMKGGWEDERGEYIW